MGCVALNLYYPKPGARGYVLQTRKRATEIRRQLGLAPGRILYGPGTHLLSPIMWECPFESIAAHEHDMRQRASCREFELVRAKMSSLLERFERTIWWIKDGGDTFQSRLCQGITVFNGYFAADERIELVLAQRIHASDTRVELGFARGRVLKLVTESEQLPAVLWQMDYPNVDIRAEEQRRLESTPQFRKVMARMRGLHDGFERGNWGVVADQD